MTSKVLIYVQHLLGIGHLKRSAQIAKIAAAKGMKVGLVSGGKRVPHLDCGNAQFFQLPPAYSDTAFSAIYEEAGIPASEEWKKFRARLLLEFFDDFAPDVLLIEMFPFGRRAFRFELLPLLARANKSRIPIACSVRDILVKKTKPARNQEIIDLVREYFDLVLVHGDSKLCPFNFPLTAEIEAKIRYTGYVSPLLNIQPEEGDEILVSAGGGAAGFAMLKEALKARPNTMFAKAPWRVITGSNISDEDYRKLEHLAGSEVQIERFRSDFLHLLARCRLSISQGGYNTILEILQCRKPALIVPFDEAGESEQKIRAELLAQKGLIECLLPRDMSKMAEAIDQAGNLHPGEFGLDVNGAEKTAAFLQELADGR